MEVEASRPTVRACSRQARRQGALTQAPTWTTAAIDSCLIMTAKRSEKLAVAGCGVLVFIAFALQWLLSSSGEIPALLNRYFPPSRDETLFSPSALLTFVICSLALSLLGLLTLRRPYGFGTTRPRPNISDICDYLGRQLEESGSRPSIMSLGWKPPELEQERLLKLYYSGLSKWQRFGRVFSMAIFAIAVFALFNALEQTTWSASADLPPLVFFGMVGLFFWLGCRVWFAGLARGYLDGFRYGFERGRDAALRASSSEGRQS
jgi:hypothetical protein